MWSLSVWQGDPSGQIQTSAVDLSTKAIPERLLHLKARLRARRLEAEYAGDEPPLRSELFSADQMQQHGKTLASSHHVSPERAPDQLLPRLHANKELLLGVRDLLAEAVQASRRITPAGEWLLDNFYLIEEQIRAAKRHLPKGYSRELPRLLDSLSAGLPRVYCIALETISHGDGRVDAESLRRLPFNSDPIVSVSFRMALAPG